MKIFDTEYNFYLSVGASQVIAMACPDEDISKVGMLFDLSYAKSVEASKMMAVTMSKAHEDLQKFIDPSYEPHYLTKEIIDLLQPSDMKKLNAEVIEAFNRDQQQSVEAEALPTSKNVKSGEEP